MPHKLGIQAQVQSVQTPGMEVRDIVRYLGVGYVMLEVNERLVQDYRAFPENKRASMHAQVIPKRPPSSRVPPSKKP